MREPAAGFGGCEQIGKRSIERSRLFRGNIVTGARDHQQAGCRHRAFKKHTAIDARLIFVTEDDKQWHRKFLQCRLHLPKRWTLELEIEHGLRVTFSRMLSQHAREFRITARILVLLRLAHRSVRIFCRRSRDALLSEHLSGLGSERLHFLTLLYIRARTPAASCGSDRDTTCWSMDADVQRSVAAHGVADDMRFFDLQGIHDRDHVVARNVLAVFRAVFGHVGWRITALAVSDAAMGTGEEAHLHLPSAIVAGVFMDEDHRRTASGFFDVEPRPISSCDVRHHALRLLAVDYLHANESGVKSRSRLQAK